MLSIVFAAVSALTAKTAVAAGASIAAAAVGLKKAKKRKELIRQALEQEGAFDSEAFEAAFKEALEKAVKK